MYAVSTPADDPQALAFAVAVKLIVQRLPIPLTLTDSMRWDISAIRKASAIEPDVDVQRWFDDHVPDRDERLALGDALIAVETSATDAAYVYGLAVGLTLASGGVR